MKPKIVYLSGNYHRSKKEYFDLATSLWSQGWPVYCPHLNCQNFNIVQISDSELIEGNMIILEKCDILLTTSDYTSSPNSILEHAKAKSLGKEVYYSIEELGYKYG